MSKTAFCVSKNGRPSEHKQEAIDREIADCTANLDAIQKDFDEHGIKEAAVEFPEDLSLQIQEAGRRKDELGEALTAALDRLEHQKAMEKEYALKVTGNRRTEKNMRPITR